MKVAVVVGRFQTPNLHSGHISLLEKASLQSDHVLVFIGVSAIAGTKRNPMDYVTRQLMVAEQYPKSIETDEDDELGLNWHHIMPLADYEDDSAWSENLDNEIAKYTKFGDEVTLYGGDDSFLDCYDGIHKHNIRRLRTTPRESATAMRKDIITGAPQDSEAFRAGIIYAIGNTRDTVSCTVDVVCYNTDVTKIIVGRKKGEKLWRFPGGFVDATDKNAAAAARRELREETGITLEGDLECIGTLMVDDWRFRNSPDKAVMTTLFVGSMSWGTAQAGDDLVELKWISPHDDRHLMNPGHQKLYDMLGQWTGSPLKN